MIELDLCPFCGSEAELPEIQGGWAVHCHSCGYWMMFYERREKAMAIWNKRAGVAHIKEYCGKHEHCDTCIYWMENKNCVFEGIPADWKVK